MSPVLFPRRQRFFPRNFTPVVAVKKEGRGEIHQMLKNKEKLSKTYAEMGKWYFSTV